MEELPGGLSYVQLLQVQPKLADDLLGVLRLGDERCKAKTSNLEHVTFESTHRFSGDIFCPMIVAISSISDLATIFVSSWCTICLKQLHFVTGKRQYVPP